MMDQEFFGTTGDTAIQNQQYGSGHFQSQDNAPDDQFQFSDPSKYVSIENVQPTSYPITEPDNETIKRIQEEQTKLQEKLREKSNTEYEEKLKRKQEGRKQLEQFLSKKQKQTASRKAENIEKEKQLLANNAKLSEEAGWKKVSANVGLKQGEYKGKKDTNRMRQAIINKKNDQV